MWSMSGCNQDRRQSLAVVERVGGCASRRDRLDTVRGWYHADTHTHAVTHTREKPALRQPRPVYPPHGFFGHVVQDQRRAATCARRLYLGSRTAHCCTAQAPVRGQRMGRDGRPARLCCIGRPTSILSLSVVPTARPQPSQTPDTRGPPPASCQNRNAEQKGGDPHSTVGSRRARQPARSAPPPSINRRPPRGHMRGCDPQAWRPAARAVKSVDGGPWRGGGGTPPPIGRARVAPAGANTVCWASVCAEPRRVPPRGRSVRVGLAGAAATDGGAGLHERPAAPPPRPAGARAGGARGARAPRRRRRRRRRRRHAAGAAAHTRRVWGGAPHPRRVLHEEAQAGWNAAPRAPSSSAGQECPSRRILDGASMGLENPIEACFRWIFDGPSMTVRRGSRLGSSSLMIRCS